MSPSTLEKRYRLLVAALGDSDRGPIWRERLGPSYGEATELLIRGLGADLAIDPRDLDGQHVAELLKTLLPARMSGEESFRDDLPDLLEDVLTQLVVEEGLSTTFELLNGAQGAREAFSRAFDDPERPRFQPPPEEPDRRPAAKIGRNSPCPCGSGKKYKKCCQH